MTRAVSKADAATASIDELATKIAALDNRLKGFDSVDTRVDALMRHVADAQTLTDKLTAPDGNLQKHRQAVNQLASQALEAQSASAICPAIGTGLLERHRPARNPLREVLAFDELHDQHAADAACVCVGAGQFLDAVNLRDV